MLLPRWLDDELHGRGWALVGAGAIVVLTLGWIAWARLAAPEAPPPASLVPRGAPELSPAPPPAAVAVVVAEPASAASAPALPACAHQQLDLTTADGVQRACVSATRTRQNGSVRSFVVEPEGTSGWQLAIDTAAERVLAVRLRRAAQGTQPAALFACEGRACQGVAIGAPDAHGARTLTVSDARLQTPPPGQRRRPPGSERAPRATDAPDAPAVHLRAALAIPPDHQQAMPPCPDPGITVVEGQGGSVRLFCPLGGAGYEIDDDGRVRFAFRDLEGRQLVVALAADRGVASVSYGALTCRAPQCGGVDIQAQGDAGDWAVARRFTFSGTTLGSAPGGGRRATLNGTVTMPSQE